MIVTGNPALAKFVQQLGDELVLAQVLIRRSGNGFALQHVADREAADGALRTVMIGGLRAVAQFTADGAFRPLKSTPNLPGGWRTIAGDAAALGAALDQLYPGAVADWFAALSDAPPVTDYREFTARQSGMYRITTMLDDGQAAGVIRACCVPDSCLKRRLWSVAGLAPDAECEKSVIPCLEPCAVLMESARKAVRAIQGENAGGAQQL